VATPPPQNLLRNSDFEIDANRDERPDRWSSDPRFLRTDYPGRVSGSFVGRVEAEADGSAAVIQQTVSVAGDTGYLFSRWVNIPLATGFSSLDFHVTWLDASGNALGSKTESITADTGGEWVHLSSSWLSIPTAVKARIEIAVSGLNGTIYVDRFSWRR
jgi:hypothetical protein